MSDTPTPITDELFNSLKFGSHIYCINAANALAKHARHLETALAAMTAERDRLEKEVKTLNQCVLDWNESYRDMKAQRDAALAEREEKSKTIRMLEGAYASRDERWLGEIQRVSDDLATLTQERDSLREKLGEAVEILRYVVAEGEGREFYPLNLDGSENTLFTAAKLATIRADGEGKAKMVGATSKDWTEDFARENGKYNSRCIACGQMFIGHKRRVICKACTSTHKTGKEQVDERAVSP